MGHPAIHETVVSLLREGAGKRVLDIPTGEGALAKELLSMGHDVVCADLYPGIFKLTSVGVIEADLDSRLPFDDDEFDVVVCVEGLEHIENPANAIREFSRLVKPDGRLLISVPNIQNIEERLKWFFGGYTSHFKPLSGPVREKIEEEYGGIEEVALHVNPIGYSEVRYLLEKNGFVLQNVMRDKKKNRSWMFLPLIWLIRLVGHFGSQESKAEKWSNELNSDPVLYGGNTLIFEAKRQ